MKLTFGKNKASLRLEAIVADKPAARRRVSALLSEYTAQLMGIITARDPHVVRLCLQLLKTHTVKRVDTIQCLSPETRMYCKNVIIGRFRAHLNGFNTVVIMRENAKKRLTSKRKSV